MLENFQAGCEAGEENSDYMLFHVNNTAFHDLILERHFNTEAIKIMKQHSIWLRTLSRRNPLTVAHMRRSNQEHREFIDAVQRGDPDRAVAVMERHMQNARRHLSRRHPQGARHGDGQRPRARPPATARARLDAGGPGHSRADFEEDYIIVKFCLLFPHDRTMILGRCEGPCCGSRGAARRTHGPVGRGATSSGPSRADHRENAMEPYATIRANRRAPWALGCVLAVSCLGLMPAGAGEAPSLAPLVSAGTLPALDKRLPDKPLVVKVVDRVGTYGGNWHSALVGGSDEPWLMRTMTYENLMRWSPDWSQVIPNIAESVEASPDATEYTFHLRKGMKWSDGAPFTSEDIAFWHRDLLLNKQFTLPAEPFINSDGTPVGFTKIDETTFKFTFKKPKGLFLQFLATARPQDNASVRYPRTT